MKTLQALVCVLFLLVGIALGQNAATPLDPLQRAIDHATPGARLDGTIGDPIHRGITIRKPLELVGGRYAPDQAGRSILVLRPSGAPPGRVTLRAVDATGTLEAFAEDGHPYDLELWNSAVRGALDRPGIYTPGRVGAFWSVVRGGGAASPAPATCLLQPQRSAVLARDVVVMNCILFAGDAGAGPYQEPDGSPCAGGVFPEPCAWTGAPAVWCSSALWWRATTFVGGRAPQWTNLACEGPRGTGFESASGTVVAF